jgi:hypothetical protein
MINCADLGCSIGKGDGLCRIIKFSIRETAERGFACFPCNLTWWVENESDIPGRIDDYFSNTPSEVDLMSAIYGKKPNYLYKGKYRPIIIDDDYIQFSNKIRDLRLIRAIKNESERIKLIESGEFISKRIRILDVNQVKHSADAFNVWINYRTQKVKHTAIYAFPAYYGEVISRDVWDFIKDTNHEIQILDEEGNEIPRPSR